MGSKQRSRFYTIKTDNNPSVKEREASNTIDHQKNNTNSFSSNNSQFESNQSTSTVGSSMNRVSTNVSQVSSDNDSMEKKTQEQITLDTIVQYYSIDYLSSDLTDVDFNQILIYNDKDALHRKSSNLKNDIKNYKKAFKEFKKNSNNLIEKLNYIINKKIPTDKKENNKSNKDIFDNTKRNHERILNYINFHIKKETQNFNKIAPGIIRNIICKIKGAKLNQTMESSIPDKQDFILTEKTVLLSLIMKLNKQNSISNIMFYEIHEFVNSLLELQNLRKIILIMKNKEN